MMIRLSVVLTLLCSLVSTHSFAGDDFYDLLKTPLAEGETPVTRFGKVTLHLIVKQTKLQEQQTRCSFLLNSLPPSPPEYPVQLAATHLLSLNTLYLVRSAYVTGVHRRWTQGEFSFDSLDHSFGAALAGASNNDPVVIAQAKLNQHKQAAQFFENLVFEHLLTTGNRDLITAGRFALKYEQDKVETWATRLGAAKFKLQQMIPLKAKLENEIIVQHAQFKRSNDIILNALEQAKKEKDAVTKHAQMLMTANSKLLQDAQFAHAVPSQTINRLTKERDDALALVATLRNQHAIVSTISNLMGDDDA